MMIVFRFYIMKDIILFILPNSQHKTGDYAVSLTILASSFSASAILLVSLESTTKISPCVF